MSYQILTTVKNVNLKKICMYLMIFKGGKNALSHFFDTGHKVLVYKTCSGPRGPQMRLIMGTGQWIYIFSMQYPWKTGTQDNIAILFFENGPPLQKYSTIHNRLKLFKWPPIQFFFFVQNYNAKKTSNSIIEIVMIIIHQYIEYSI